MIQFLKSIFSGDKALAGDQAPQVDVSVIVREIKKREESAEVPLGKRIYSTEYQGFEVRLDRDITKNYRVTVYQGRERTYSFTVFGKQGDYDVLKDAFTVIFDFLNGDRGVSQLPDNEKLKGFHYGAL
jgi:hypothetical protein